MTDRLSKSAALLGLLAPFPTADQPAPICSARTASIASALKANPTGDALCASLLDLGDRITTTTVTPDADFTSTTVIPVVAGILTVNAPTSIVTVTATVELCAQNERRAAPTGARKNRKDELVGKLKGKNGKPGAAKVVGKKGKGGKGTGKGKASSKTKSIKSTPKVTGGKGGKSTQAAAKKTTVVGNSKVKTVKGTTLTFATGTQLGASTKVSAGVSGIITASAQVAYTQTITVSGTVIVTVITPTPSRGSILTSSFSRLGPSVSSVLASAQSSARSSARSGVASARTIVPTYTAPPKPNFSSLSCAAAPAEFQANPCDLIEEACRCARLPVAYDVIVTAYPTSVPTQTLYNSTAVAYTSVPIVVITETITATGCPTAPTVPSVTFSSRSRSGSSSVVSTTTTTTTTSTSASVSINAADKNKATSVATSASPATTTAAPAATSGCDNLGAEYAVYSIPNSILSKRQLPVSVGSGLGAGGGGIIGGGISIASSQTLSSVAGVVTTIDGQVTTVSSVVAAQTGVISSAENSLGSALGDAGASVTSGVSSVLDGATTTVSNIQASATSLVSAVSSSLSSVASSVLGNGQASVVSSVSSLGGDIQTEPTIPSTLPTPQSTTVSPLLDQNPGQIPPAPIAIPPALSALTPILSGTTSPDPSTLLSQPQIMAALRSANTALVQRAYLRAPRTGTYTFLLSGLTPEGQQAILWTGAPAQKAFSSSFEDGSVDLISCLADAASRGTCTFALDLDQGQFLPYRLLLLLLLPQRGGGGSAAPDGSLGDSAGLTITGPGGDVLVDSNVAVAPGDVVRFGCGDEAARAPAFGRV